MRLGSVLMVVAVGVSTACSVVVDTSATQCTTTADCVARGGDFARLVCGPAGVCLKQAGCDTNQDCITLNNGQPFMCRKSDRTCVALSNKDCKPSLFQPGDIANDDTVWFGEMNAFSGIDQQFGLAIHDGLELAYKDFVKLASGLPPLTPGGNRRPVGIISCDAPTEATLDTEVRVANYLANDLKVPAIFGPIYSFMIIDIVQKVTLTSGTLVISPDSSSPGISGLPSANPRLIWRTTGSDKFSGIGAANWVTQVGEPNIRSTLKIPAGQPIRVMTLYEDYKAGGEGAFADALVVNGVPAGDPANANNVKRLQFFDSTVTTPASGQAAAAVGAAITFNPHLIYVSGAAESYLVINGVEQQWPAANGPKPRWVLNPGSQGDVHICQTFAATADRSRLRGLYGAGSSIPLRAAWDSRYKATFSDGTGPSAYGTDMYDAAYMIFYGTAAVGNNPVTGASIARAFAKIVAPPPAATFDVGPDSIFPILTAIDKGSTFGLNGTNGPLIFNDTGDRLEDFQVGCAPLNPVCDTSYLGWPSSGMYYSSAKAALVGTDGCF